VREEKTWHVPYKYKALETRKRERRGETEKRQGRDRKKREQKTGEQKNQRKREPITKKTQKQGKEERSPEKTITAIFISAFVFVIAR
jgi:hypothetical protein